MQSSSSTPLGVLKSHAHAVILIAADGVITPEVRRAIDESGAEIELIGHPLLAMAALAAHEAQTHGGPGRTLLVMADRDISDLASLVTAVRTRLPRVAIWIFERELALCVCAGSVSRAEGTAVPTHGTTHAASDRGASDRGPRQVRVGPSKQPQLRIAPAESPMTSGALDGTLDGTLDGALGAETDGDESDSIELNSGAVTREELDMLLEIMRPLEPENPRRPDAPDRSGRS